jgi:hypothetical protein
VGQRLTAIRHDSDPAFVRHCILACLEKTMRRPSANRFFLGLQAGRMDMSVLETAFDGTGTVPRVYRLRSWVPIDNYDASDEEWVAELIDDVFQKMHEADGIRAAVQFKVIPAAVPATESGLNSTSFRTEQTIAHEGLRFRSRAEVAVYDELKRRNVLFFPNPAAILGRQPPEGAEKREPDFLVCHRGRWGILEVSGKPWHSGAISTAKDHDRSRLFQHYSLICVQHFDATRCRHSPADVVDEFLLLLSKS